MGRCNNGAVQARCLAAAAEPVADAAQCWWPLPASSLVNAPCRVLAGLLTELAACDPQMAELPIPTVQACAEVEIYPEQGPIRVADAQNLVLWVLGEGANPRWCFLKASGPGVRALHVLGVCVRCMCWEAVPAAAACAGHCQLSHAAFTALVELC